MEQDKDGKNIQRWRKDRQESLEKRNYPPDLNLALEEYSNNLKEIIKIVKEKKRKIIFLTQPTMWRTGLEKDIQNLFWFGGTGNYLTQKGVKKMRLIALTWLIYYRRILPSFMTIVIFMKKEQLK
jgi:hypothetical protein